MNGNQTPLLLLKNLGKFILYEVQVLAFTRVGDGPPNLPPTAERTKDDGKQPIKHPPHHPLNRTHDLIIHTFPLVMTNHTRIIKAKNKCLHSHWVKIRLWVKATHLADAPSHTHTHSKHTHTFIMVAHSYALLHALVVSSCARHLDWHYLPRGSRHRQTHTHARSHTRLASWCPHCMKPRPASLNLLKLLVWTTPAFFSQLTQKSLMRSQSVLRQKWH